MAISQSLARGVAGVDGETIEGIVPNLPNRRVRTRSPVVWQGSENCEEYEEKK